MATVVFFPMQLSSILVLFLESFFFSKTSFRNTIRVSNSLDLDLVGPDLDPDCLQKLSSDDTSRETVSVSHKSDITVRTGIQ